MKAPTLLALGKKDKRLNMILSFSTVRRDNKRDHAINLVMNGACWTIFCTTRMILTSFLGPPPLVGTAYELVEALNMRDATPARCAIHFYENMEKVNTPKKCNILLVPQTPKILK